MKKFFAASVAVTVLASNAMASSKVCFGSTKSDDTKGIVISAEISAKEVTLKSIKGDGYEGTFPAYNSTVNGRDGKIYLEYEGANSDYQDVVMVDQTLLKKGTTGLLQIRARGEGFFNSVYFCKAAQYFDG